MRQGRILFPRLPPGHPCPEKASTAPARAGRAGKEQDKPEKSRLHRKRAGHTGKEQDAPEKVQLHRKKFDCIGESSTASGKSRPNEKEPGRIKNPSPARRAGLEPLIILPKKRVYFASGRMKVLFAGSTSPMGLSEAVMANTATLRFSGSVTVCAPAGISRETIYI